jgi:hypothetical protein
MYAVVYKNRVIVGPMNWNRGIFQGSLEKEKITKTLPRIPPEQLPFTVNDDAKIMLVEEVRPEINPMVEYYYGPLWEITETKAIANYEIHDSPIESARMNFKNQASGERWRKETAGIKLNIQNIEVTIDTTRDGRNVFAQKLSLMSENETVNWKFSEGWLTLTKAELSQIVTAIDNHIQSCFDWEKSINDSIDLATTKKQLIAIEIVEKTEENTVE